MSEPGALCVTCGYPLPETRCPECGRVARRLETGEGARAVLRATFPAALGINGIVAVTILNRVIPGLFFRPEPHSIITGVTLLVWAALLPSLALAAPHGPARGIWLLTAPMALLSWIVPSLLGNLIWIDYRAHWVQAMTVVILLGGVPTMTVVALVLLRRSQLGLLRAIGLPEPPAYRILRLVSLGPALVLLAATALSLWAW